MIGVMPTKKALELAKEVGLDLVEVAPTAKPPVCRILDFGKYRYELSKKQKESKATTQKMKEVKFRVKIDTHDYLTKIRRAEDFLAKGSKLKLTLMFRGREMEHTELGFETIKRATEDLQGVATADSEPRLAGRNVSVTLSPCRSTGASASSPRSARNSPARWTKSASLPRLRKTEGGEAADWTGRTG